MVLEVGRGWGNPTFLHLQRTAVSAAAAGGCCQWFESRAGRFVPGTGSRGWIMMGKEDAHFAQNYEERASNSRQRSPWKEGLELWLGCVLV